MKPLYVIKLGGSIITDKSRTDSTVFNTGTVDRLFAEIQVFRESTSADIILVHGAGGYIHALAHKHSLTKGARHTPEGTTGCKLIHAANDQLNQLITKSATHHNITIEPVHPRKQVLQNKGRFVSLNTQKITSLLKEGSVPVLYGEMVPDTAWNYSIFRGTLLYQRLLMYYP